MKKKEDRSGAAIASIIWTVAAATLGVMIVVTAIMVLVSIFNLATPEGLRRCKSLGGEYSWPTDKCFIDGEAV